MKMKNDPLKALKFYAEKSDYHDVRGHFVNAGQKARQAIPQMELIMAFVEAYKKTNEIQPQMFNDWEDAVLKEHKAWQKLKQGMDDG